MRANQFIPEGRVKELAQDLKDKTMSDADFEKKYSKTRADARAAMRKPASESVAGPKNCWPGYRKTGTQPGTGKNAGKRVNDCEKIKEQGVAEGPLGEFAPGNSGGESGRWYNDSDIAAIVGDGWYEDMDVSGNVPKNYMIQQAQNWLDDQGYNVQVLNCKLNDDDMDWFIEGTFDQQGVAEGEKIGNMDADDFDDAMARLKKLAGAGPMKTVYDPQKRVYKNMPTAQQPAQQPKK